MKINVIIFFFVMLMNVSCGKSKDQTDQVDLFYQPLSPEYFQDSLHPSVYTFAVNLDLYKFEDLQKDKIEEAIEIIKLVIATEKFREQVLNHTYMGQKTFVDNGGLSNAQIYQKILEGAEDLHPYKNHAIDAEVELYFANNNVVGYTYSHTKRIWVNTKYFENYSAAGIAHNIFHEWLHKLGFNHAAKWSNSRDYSVPYALGNLIGKIGKDFL